MRGRMKVRSVCEHGRYEAHKIERDVDSPVGPMMLQILCDGGEEMNLRHEDRPCCEFSHGTAPVWVKVEDDSSEDS